jgi:hypothetical protein
VRTLLLFAIVALSAAVSSGAATDTAAATLPNPCKLVTRSDAQMLAGIKLQPPLRIRTGCTYNGYPTGPVAQVEIYVDSTVPRTLTIDRQLKHKIWRVPRLGDQAFEEEWHIFVRKGKVWITINLVRTEAWPTFKPKLERAARVAINRVPRPTRRAAGSRSTVKHLPAPVRVGRETWQGKERRYGGTITQYRGVVYQPHVVLVGGGATAIRGRSADGLTWTVAANAPGISELRVGNIMLATTFAAGRVLKLTHVGGNVRVVLGPVSLTDVIRDGVFESKSPIRIAKPLFYKTTLSRKRGKSSARTGAASAATDKFSMTPICCSGGIGVHIGYSNGTTGKLSATVQLEVERVAVKFRIAVGAGRLIDADLELTGVGGLKYDIWGSTLDGSGNVKSGPIFVPESITIPLVGPFAVTLTQAFDVSMQFLGRATVRTHGDYQIVGSLGFGYRGGKAKPERAKMETGTPISQNTLSLGVGANSVSLGWSIRATVGIGGVGFAAGAWFALRPGLAFTADGSHLQSLEFGCATVAVDVSGLYGVGFSIPEFVQDTINAILSLVRVPPIPSSIGPSWGPYEIWQPPRAEWCPPRKPPREASQ